MHCWELRSARQAAAEDMAAGCVLRDKEGLHLKIWRGHSQQWSIMLSENTAGSVTGFLSAEREAIAPVSTHAEYTAVLEDHFRHMPASLRRLIADGIMVRALLLPMHLPMQLQLLPVRVFRLMRIPLQLPLRTLLLPAARQPCSGCKQGLCRMRKADALLPASG